MSDYLKPISKEIINGKTFNIYRSSNNMYIQKVGTTELYTEAKDLEFINHKYIETSIPIEVEEVENENDSHEKKDI